MRVVLAWLLEPYEVFRTFEVAGVPSKFDIAMMGQCPGKPMSTNVGYAFLLGIPPTIETMQSFFCEVKSQIEVEAARWRISSRHVSP